MQLAYISALIVSIFGMAMIDRRFKLAFFYDKKRTLKTLSVAVCIFIIWDLAGITLGIFHKGDSPFSLPFTLLPELPLEELLFLLLLCYISLLSYRWFTAKERA